MGSIARKMKRRREKADQKAAQKAAEGVQDAIETMPTTCGECGLKFDKKDKEKVNSWSLAVYDDGRVHLACPDCGPSEDERIAAKTRREAENN
jgi:hypothetical protein